MSRSKKEPKYEKLGEVIDTLRDFKNLSQEALAKKAAIEIRTLRKIIKGETANPNFETLENIAAVFDMTGEELKRASLRQDDKYLQSVVLKQPISAPRAECAFFGIGRITIAVPTRTMPNRNMSGVSGEDMIARRQLSAFLRELSFNVDDFDIPVDGKWALPFGDVIAICGPLNSHVTAEAVATDPFIAFEKEDDTGLWTIRNRQTGERFVSPMDRTAKGGKTAQADLAYVGRLNYQGRPLLIIAGIHAIGSVGAVHYLIHHLTDLYEDVRKKCFSIVVRSEYKGSNILKSEILCPPRIHP